MPTKCPAKEKMRKEKQKNKRGGEKAKSKSQVWYVSKFCFLRMPNAQANILNLDQRNAKV